MQRRQFLQLTTTTALATALPAIAAPRPPKKLALLIGINSYPQKTIPNLKGCLNDIELQRALLIDRLGFQPQDILTLTNQQATRTAIIQAIETHLIRQAQPNDIIIIHFSGHGSRVQDPDPITDDGLNGTIAPYDYGDPQAPSVNAIMGKTLHLLLCALPTDNVTTILDCCHAEGGLRGDSVTRSIDHLRSPGNHPTTSEADRADQTRWLKTLGWTPQDLQTSRKKGHAKGIGLGSTGRNQLAADAPFDDFHAGAFTYLLTRALWQADSTTTLRQLFDQLAVNTKTLAQSARIFQNPTYSLPPGQKTLADRPPYFITSDRPPAEGAIRPSSSKELEFWLGGIAPQSLPAFKQGSQFAIIDDRGRTIGELEQTRRSGLIGYGKLKTGKLPTTERPLLRETIRGIPANLSLRLGLTPSLQSATASITQALEPLGRIQIAPDNIDLWLT
jgi:Caspase domain